MKKLTALLVNDFCAAETTAMPATKTGAPKRAAGQRPLQAAPSKEADKSKAELEKRLKDEIERLVKSAEALGTMR